MVACVHVYECLTDTKCVMHRAMDNVLPIDALVQVFSFLPWRHNGRLSTVSKTFNKAANADYLWAFYYKEMFGTEPPLVTKFTIRFHQKIVWSSQWLCVLKVIKRSVLSDCWSEASVSTALWKAARVQERRRRRLQCWYWVWPSQTPAHKVRTMYGDGSSDGGGHGDGNSYGAVWSWWMMMDGDVGDGDGDSSMWWASYYVCWLLIMLQDYTIHWYRSRFSEHVENGCINAPSKQARVIAHRMLGITGTAVMLMVMMMVMAVATVMTIVVMVMGMWCCDVMWHDGVIV